jgi:hypothetical protein
MERTKVNKDEAPVILQDDRIWWKKIGGGSARLRIGGVKVMIKPNQKFQATVDEIPKTQRDVIIPLEEIKGDDPVTGKILKAPLPKYSVEPRGKSKSLFDVVDSKGKILNDKPLPKAIAEQLKTDLEK